MFFAIAALLIQPPLAPKIALIQPVNSELSSALTVSESTLPSAPVVADATIPPTSEPSADEQPDTASSAPAVDASAPTAFLLAKPRKPATVSVAQLVAENRRNQLLWRGLGIASHGAAAFDAWSTRRAITQHGAQELNPMLRPFAGNASLYVAIQVAPTVFDYAGRKMMYSRNSWVRHMWWVPQTASFVTSVLSGVHNLNVR